MRELIVSENDQQIDTTFRLFGSQENFSKGHEEAKEAIFNSARRPTNLLPPVIRYISGSGRFILLERPPQVMDFYYHGTKKNAVSEATLQEYQLPLPWTTYAIGLDDRYRPYMAHVFCSQTAITGLDHKLFLLPITNYDSEGKFCAPFPIDHVPKGISEGINTAYSVIWESNFNRDIEDCIRLAYQYRRPWSIFQGKGERREIGEGERVKASHLFKRWEEFTLDEVLEWKDWLPIRWNGRKQLRVSDVIVFLRNSEQQFNSTLMINKMRQKLMIDDQH